MITKEEIQQIAELARIRLSEEEVEQYEKEFETILAYVCLVQEAPLPELKNEYVLTNRLRDDEEVYEAGSFTEELLREVPHREGDYVKVKKVL